MCLCKLLMQKERFIFVVTVIKVGCHVRSPNCRLRPTRLAQLVPQAHYRSGAYNINEASQSRVYARVPSIRTLCSAVLIQSGCSLAKVSHVDGAEAIIL